MHIPSTTQYTYHTHITYTYHIYPLTHKHIPHTMHIHNTHVLHTHTHTHTIHITRSNTYTHTHTNTLTIYAHYQHTYTATLGLWIFCQSTAFMLGIFPKKGVVTYRASPKTTMCEDELCVQVISWHWIPLAWSLKLADICWWLWEHPWSSPTNKHDK